MFSHHSKRVSRGLWYCFGHHPENEATGVGEGGEEEALCERNTRQQQGASILACLLELEHFRQINLYTVCIPCKVYVLFIGMMIFIWLFLVLELLTNP